MLKDSFPVNRLVTTAIAKGKGPRGEARGPAGRLGGNVGGIDIRGRLGLPLGAVEVEDGLQRDFADALLDGGLLLLLAVLLVVLAGAQLPHELKVRSLLQCRGERCELAPRHGAMPIAAGIVIALVVLPGA